ncbi:MAG: hypothetical protein ABEL04_05485 [Salinibacter sp.]|uniref:hypothetical protein n=1 Tax=Salinibacter sp. TaxID=2065818 RepID=UPI0035D4712B
MDADYQTRHRHGNTLFALPRPELKRRLRHLAAEDGWRLACRRREDARLGVSSAEIIYLNAGPAAPGRVVAVRRHDEARMTGHASLASEPAAMPAPRSAEALIAFAEKAKNGGNYPAANAAFALVLDTCLPRAECSLSIREPATAPTGEMTDGYYDLAYVRAGEQETCIPVPKLQGEVAYWFAAHADRREPRAHNRTPSGAGPTLEDLKAMVGPETVQSAVAAVLRADPSSERSGAQSG